MSTVVSQLFNSLIVAIPELEGSFDPATADMDAIKMHMKTHTKAITNQDIEFLKTEDIIPGLSIKPWVDELSASSILSIWKYLQILRLVGEVPGDDKGKEKLTELFSAITKAKVDDEDTPLKREHEALVTLFKESTLAPVMAETNERCRALSLFTTMVFDEDVEISGLVLKVMSPETRNAVMSACPNVAWVYLDTLRKHEFTNAMAAKEELRILKGVISIVKEKVEEYGFGEIIEMITKVVIPNFSEIRRKAVALAKKPVVHKKRKNRVVKKKAIKG